MDLFGHHEKTELEIIKIQAETIDRLTHEHCEPHKVALVLNLYNTKSTLRIMALSLASNQIVIGTLGLTDTTNPATVVTGTFAGTTATSDTPAAFTALVDANGNVDVTGVAAGTGNLTVTTTAAYTDSTGAAQSVSLSLTVAVTVTAVVVADSVALSITFGNATTQPVAASPATPAS
jgi:hypothetical protein